MEGNRLEIVDLELEDDILKGVEVIDPYPKGKKSEHGLPEHQWCPKKENSSEAIENETKVKCYFIDNRRNPSSFDVSKGTYTL